MNKKVISSFFPLYEDVIQKKTKSAPLDNKIQVLALKQLPPLMVSGHELLSSVIKMSSAIIQAALVNKRPKYIPEEEKKAAHIRRPLLGTLLPIGLKPNSYAPWLNAFLQFILFVPALRILFDYTPKSFLPFNLFIDQYWEDQQKGLAFCSFDTMVLLETLSNVFQKGFVFFRELFDLFSLFMQIRTLVGGGRGHSKSKELVERELNGAEFEKSFLEEQLPREILTAQKYPFKLENDIKKQLVLPSGSFYELNAFVEYREDPGFSGSYLAYLKHGGIWYQCDDLRIVQIRSEYLQMAINRSLLLHYQKVEVDSIKKRV